MFAMEHYKSTGKVDPDYESYNSALELNEEEDKKENLIKLRKIIEDEYNKDILQREEQIEQIELQICKVRKLLHLLRYSLVMSYYKKKELEYSEDEAPASDSLIIPDSQNRIHPAIKKLLGKNVTSLDHLTVKDKRKTSSRNLTNYEISKPKDSPPDKKIKLDVECKTVEDKIVETIVKDKNLRNRKKTKYRLIVGNISKWMPSSEDNALTHKWMVYVRGPKDEPNVSHIIDKVVFYLHPSYKPYDVVEVSESPFHLSRRGWGEFPIRVQVFFKVTLNKPIDVVHNLKLDTKFTGRQTLGNETIVDVFLYDDNHHQLPKVKNEEIKIETEDIKIEIEEAPSSIEHDYCCEITNEVNFDHSYCLSPSHVSLPLKKEKIEQDESNALIYGLDGYYTDEYTQIKKTNNKKTDSTNISLNEYFVLPKNRFKNMGEALPYLFKRLPLYSDLANNINYKRSFPFTASSLKEFVSWNIGKRRSSEWSRARTIKKLLHFENIQGLEKWNTKAILMYGRSHDYTPFISYKLFNRDSSEKKLLMNCYSNSKPFSFCLKNNVDEDMTISVDSDSDSSSPKKQLLIDITDSRTNLECLYIRQTASDVGVTLKSEEIIEGVKMNGAEIMILEAVKCLANNLIRRAKNHRVCTKPQSPNTSAINKEDVEVAINERPEMFCLLQFRNERKKRFF